MTPGPPSTARAWAAARRVLAVRLDNFGDVLMTTPALRAVRESVPAAELTLLASPSGAAVARCVPAVDDVIAFDAPWVKNVASEGGAEAGGRNGGHDALGRAEARLIDTLAARRFDAAVIFTVCTQSALPAAMLCRLAGIPLRLAHSRENPYGLLTDWVRETDVVGDGMRHEVERQLALVAALGWAPGDERLLMRYDAAHAAGLANCLAAAGVDAARPYVVVHVGATAPSRRYPAEAFGIAAEMIARRSGCRIVFTGDAGEAALIDRAIGEFGDPARAVSLAGHLGLGELAALIDGAALVVANNTGPLHIAAAMQTPVVALYALTNPQHTPWKVPSRVLNHDVPCRNCLRSVCPQGHHDCLRRVEPVEVAEAAFDLLRPSGAAAHRVTWLTEPV